MLRYAEDSLYHKLRLIEIIRSLRGIYFSSNHKIGDVIIYSVESSAGGPRLPTCCESDNVTSQFPRKTFSEEITRFCVTAPPNIVTFPVLCKLYASLPVWVYTEG